MNDRNLLRGLFLVAISLAFGLTSLTYNIGEFGRAGPGLFPLMVSIMLAMVGIATVVRSRFIPRVPMDMKLKNIGVIIGSLCGFSLVSHFINMTAGIVFMVFFSAMAANAQYSVARNLKISAGLVAIAFAFYKLLGLQLPLY